MAEQTIRVNVPDGYEIVRIGVPNNGELILSGGDVIPSPPTIYDRVIVRKSSDSLAFDQGCHGITLPSSTKPI